jgi:large subunit ribosomal protein L22
MIAKATARYIRVSPQKARLVVDLIRGKNVNEARQTLQFTNKRVTKAVDKVLWSAIHNAQEKADNIDVDDLFVERAYVNEGPRLKRVRPAPMGRAYRYLRRMSHITIELGEKD